MQLKEEVKFFLTNTSIKGIPRAIRSPTHPLRALWVVAVISFLCMAVYQTTLLVQNFLTYPAVTFVEEKLVQLDPAFPNHVGLPNVHVCNLNPISSNISNIPLIPTIKEFHDHVVNVTACEHCDEETKNKTKALKTDLLTKAGYFSHIGVENSRMIGHEMKDLIINCKLVINMNFKRKEIPCDTRITISQYSNMVYYNCYKIRFVGPLTQGITAVTGISLVLYLDNYNVDQYDYLSGDDYDHRVGAKLAVSQEGSVPAPDRDGLDVSPGTHNYISFLYKERNRLPHPHGSCYDKSHYTGVVLPDGEAVKYSIEFCLTKCLEEYVSRSCQCWDLDHTIGLMLHLNDSVPPCGGLREGVDAAIVQRECVLEANNHSRKACLGGRDKCYLACKELVFKLNHWYTPWPPKPVRPPFYDKFIKGRSFEKRFKNYFENLQDDETRRELEDAIAQNFLKVHFNLGDYRYTNYRDDPKFSISILLSQLGGTLNLYSGITMIIIVELLDFLLRLFGGGQKNSQKENVDRQNRVPEAQQADSAI